MAYDLLEPFGGPADDARAGTIAAMIANVHQAKGYKPRGPRDFFASADERCKRIFPNQTAGIDPDEAEDIATIKALFSGG